MFSAGIRNMYVSFKTQKLGLLAPGCCLVGAKDPEPYTFITPQTLHPETLNPRNPKAISLQNPKPRTLNFKSLNPELLDQKPLSLSPAVPDAPTWVPPRDGLGFRVG